MSWNCSARCSPPYNPEPKEVAGPPKKTGPAARRLEQMRQMARKDRELHARGEPATSKLLMLKDIIPFLSRRGIHEQTLSLGLHKVLAEWLSPTPDGALPALAVREEVLRLLLNPSLPRPGPEALDTSGLGDALLRLSVDERETQPNRRRANRLIAPWVQQMRRCNCRRARPYSTGGTAVGQLENLAAESRPMRPRQRAGPASPRPVSAPQAPPMSRTELNRLLGGGEDLRASIRALPRIPRRVRPAEGSDPERGSVSPLQ